MTILLYSMAPLDRQTDGIRQPGAQPVSLSICQWTTGRLVQPPIYRGVLAQQPCLLCNAANSIPTGHRTNSPHGLWAETEPLRPRDSQRIHKEDAVCHWRSQVRNLQGVRGHDVLLQCKEISGPRVQTRRLDIPRRIGYQNNTSVSKVVTSQTRTLRDRTPSRTISLLFQVAPRNETVAPSVQHCKIVYCPGRSDTRKEAASPAATNRHRRRTRVGNGRDIR